jgi:AAA family ATP:ADP antiporter
VRSLRSSSHYALERPSREILFTTVSREEKYKAKSFIDTVVYRGGDALSGWAFGALAAVSFVGAGVAVVWAAVAFWLGARMKSWTPAAARSSSAQP